jgi:hypothetical protein
MKKVLMAILLINISIVGFADIVGLKFAPEEFADDTYVIRFSSEDMEQLEVKELESQSYNYAFRNNTKDYELRYILFKQTEDINNFEDYKMQVSMWALMVINNITNDEEQSLNTSAYPVEAVKKEFNADYGFTNFSRDLNSDYVDGYRYIMINFYCKKGLGIMCQTILFNDLSWPATEDFIRWFHGFNFY